jgi:lysine biosynthesis protein LysW
MILADFPCPKCRAVLDLENVEEGQLVDCPQCKAPFEIPKTKQRPSPPRIPSKPVSVATQQKPPSHWGYVVLALLGGLAWGGAFFAVLTAGFYAFAAGMGAAVWLFVSAGVIQLLSDIRWHLSNK